MLKRDVTCMHICLCMHLCRWTVFHACGATQASGGEIYQVWCDADILNNTHA